MGEVRLLIKYKSPLVGCLRALVSFRFPLWFYIRGNVGVFHGYEGSSFNSQSILSCNHTLRGHLCWYLSTTPLASHS